MGKIYDIFDGEGVTEKIKTTGNTNGIAFTKACRPGILKAWPL